MARREPAREPERLLTAEEVADLLRVSIHALAQLRTKRRGPTYLKFGRSVRYRPSDVLAYLDDAEIESLDDHR